MHLTASVPSGGRVSNSSKEAWTACTACMLELMVPVKACWADVCKIQRTNKQRWQLESLQLHRHVSYSYRDQNPSFRTRDVTMNREPVENRFNNDDSNRLRCQTNRDTIGGIYINMSLRGNQENTVSLLFISSTCWQRFNLRLIQLVWYDLCSIVSQN